MYRINYPKHLEEQTYVPPYFTEIVHTMYVHIHVSYPYGYNFRKAVFMRIRI